MIENGLELSRDAMLQELHSYCKDWLQSSMEWRKNSYEAQWRRWQRNSDAIYDPEVAAKKEPWQATAFWPITPSHREAAQAMLYRTEVGPRPAVEVQSRFDDLENDLSEDVRDMILLERDKSRYELERNKVIEDKSTYGSGFSRIRFETKMADRVTRLPVYEQIDVFNPMSVMRATMGQREILGYRDEVQQVVTYRGIVYEHISVWDVFPDPKALKVKGNTIAHRYYTNYGEIIKGAQEGYYIPEAVTKLANMTSAEQSTEDKREVESDRGIAESNTKRTEYGTRLECFEIQGKFPKKWIYINGEDIDDPEKLVPGKIRFHSATIVGIELNDSYDGEPDISKDDYMPVAGQFYGRGIPEMLKDVQYVCNAEVNQRIDAKTIKMSLSTMMAVIEKAIVDPRELERSVIGNIIRLKNPDGINDINNSFVKLEGGSLDSASFIEPQEWERVAQERTKVNRQTLATSGQVKDTNQTLGGMELLNQATGDQFAFIGMLSEFDYQWEVTRAYWRLIYSNYDQEDIIRAIGPKRAQKFLLISPEQLENEYRYYPMGIYTMESKAMRQARLAQVRQQFLGAPWLNDMAFFDAMIMAGEDDPERYKVPEADMVAAEARVQQGIQMELDKAYETKKQVEKVEALAEDVEKREMAAMLPPKPEKR